MKKSLKKLLICLLVILMIFNFMMSNINLVYADDETDTEILNETIETEIMSLIAGVADGFSGIYTWFARAGAVVISTLFQIGTYYVLITGGTSSSFSNSVYLTPYDIFFNNFALTNINIFQTNDVTAGSFVANMRNIFAACFLVFEAIGLILLAIKFFLGIIKQFLANTSPDEKKAGADLATDSIISFLLVLLMSSIVLVIILLNEMIINAISQIGSDITMIELLNAVRVAALSLNYVLGMSGTIAIVLLTFYTMKFALAYILRFITISVLIVVAPIMPVFFSISKARAGAPTALNRWLRIFISNVFVQSIHALLYTVIIIFPFATINTVFKGFADLVGVYVLILGLIFIKHLEKFVLTLFGIDDDVASLRMINREIHNVANSVTKVATAGASVYAVATGNTVAASTIVEFGKNLDSDEENENEDSSKIRDMLNRMNANTYGTMGIIGSVTSLDYGTDYPSGSSFEEDDRNRRNRDRAREEREAYEAKMSGENQKNDNGKRTGAGNEPIVLQAEQVKSDEEIEALAEQALQGAIDTANKEESSEKTNTEAEDNKKIDENEKVEIVLTDEQVQERNEIKNKYEYLLEHVKAARELRDELNQAIRESGSKIDGNKRTEIREKIDSIYQDKGAKDATDYAMSLGNGNEGDYAKMYVVYLEEDDDLKEMISSDKYGNGVYDLVNDGVKNGAITIDEGELLLHNALNVASGYKNQIEKIFGKAKSKNVENSESNQTENSKKSDSEETQVVEKDVVTENKDDVRKPKIELSAVADIPTSTINKALKTPFVKEAIKRSSENISAVQGGITTNGTITGESLARIINDMENGAYSEENYKKVKGDAISAGESDNIKRFDNNPTPENAAACGGTEAGKKYVKFTEERAAGSALLTASSLLGSTTNQTNNSNSNTNKPPTTSTGVNDAIKSLENKKANV